MIILHKNFTWIFQHVKQQKTVIRQVNSVIFQSLSKTPMPETSSTKNHIFQILYNKYSFPVILQPLPKPGVFHPNPSLPIHRLPRPGIPVFQTSFRQLNGLVTTGVWDHGRFFRCWKGKQNPDVQGDCCFLNVHFCETFQALRFHQGREKDIPMVFVFEFSSQKNVS